MDLPYPSFKDVDDKDQCVLGKMNKKLRSTIWSMKDLGKQEQHLPKSTRNDIIKCIEKDRAGKLQKIINSTKINLQTEIGTKGSKWSLVHFCARWNASTCLQLLLKRSYQQNSSQYICLVNNKTSEGYTPLMICVLYQSDQLLEQLLDYGGVDILLVDNNRISAYQMAVSSKNESAIKSVVKYQRNNRITTFLNTYKLSTKFCLPKQERTCLEACESLWKWVIREPKQKQLQQTPTSRTFSGTCFVDNQFLPIPSSISNDIQSVSEYDIEWYRLGSLFEPRVVSLFQNCSIYEVKQLNFVIKHSLTVFQTVLQFPWLLKSKIKRGQIQGMYECELFPKGLRQWVVVDDFIPCLKATRQPMFFSTTKETWSMVLQKAWAKSYGSYTAARNIKPQYILQQLMGYHAQTLDIQGNQEGLYNRLKRMSEKEYAVVLTTKKQSSLKYQDSEQETFGILSFCEKDGKQYILVNCPFLLPDWKERQRSEPLALRLVRAHYTSPNQMAVWLQISQVLTNFQSFTISYSSPCLLRTELRAKVKQLVFLRFQCQDEVSAKNILLKMFEVSQKQTEEVTIRSIEVGKNEIIDSTCVGSHQDSLGRIKCVNLSQGSFLCKIQTQNQGSGRHVGIVCYSQCEAKYQVLDEQLGKIQWLYMLRDKLSLNLQRSEKPMVQSFFNYTLLLQKVQSAEDSPVVNYSLDQVEYFVQGRKHLDGISLEKQGDYWYAIVKNKTLGDGSSLTSR